MSSRIRVTGAVLAVVALAACNTTVRGTGTQSGVPTGGPPPGPTSESSQPAPSGDPDVTPPPEAAVFEIGETGTVTDESGNPLADITVADAVQTADPPDEFSDPPTNGTFLSATVTVDNIGGDVFTVAPFDFMVRYPGGTRVEYGEGSAGVFGYDNLLDVSEVDAGATITGVIAFDVDPEVAGKQIVYADLSGRVLGAWNVP